MRFHHTFMDWTACDPKFSQQAITGGAFHSSATPRAIQSRPNIGFTPTDEWNCPRPLSSTGWALEDQLPAVLLVPLLPDMPEPVRADHRQ